MKARSDSLQDRTSSCDRTVLVTLNCCREIPIRMKKNEDVGDCCVSTSFSEMKSNNENEYKLYGLKAQ